MSSKSWSKICRMLRDPYWDLTSWPWFGYCHLSLIHLCLKFCCLNWFSNWKIWRCKEHKCSLSPKWCLGRNWRFLIGFRISNVIWIWSCSTLILKVQRHPCPFSPGLGHYRTLEVPDWGLASFSWFGYGHLSDTPMIHFVALYIDFEGDKILHVL